MRAYLKDEMERCIYSFEWYDFRNKIGDILDILNNECATLWCVELFFKERQNPRDLVKDLIYRIKFENQANAIYFKMKLADLA